jgi:hypothetical protein
MPGPIDASILAGRWIHAHEEDTADAMVFHRPTHRFPPSRLRRSFELRHDGSMTENRLGPDDRPRPTEGAWSLVDNDRLELVPADSTLPKSTQVVQMVSEDKLVLSRPK